MHEVLQLLGQARQEAGLGPPLFALSNVLASFYVSSGNMEGILWNQEGDLVLRVSPLSFFPLMFCLRVSYIQRKSTICTW